MTIIFASNYTGLKSTHFILKLSYLVQTIIALKFSKIILTLIICLESVNNWTHLTPITVPHERQSKLPIVVVGRLYRFADSADSVISHNWSTYTMYIILTYSFQAKNLLKKKTNIILKLSYLIQIDLAVN